MLTLCCRGQVAFHSELLSYHCMIVLRFACSVASLSRCLSHYLPGCLSLHYGILVGYLLGWGIPSAWSAWHAPHDHTPSCMSDSQQEILKPPNTKLARVIVACASVSENGNSLTDRRCVASQKIVYTSRFVRVILAQGPC